VPDVIHGERVTLRPFGPDDRPRLLEILREPEVARWWRADPGLDDDDTATFVIEVDGEVAGGIQYWEEDEPDYRHAGIDVFLAAAFQDRGLGSDAVRALARHLFEVRGHHRITIDPAAANTRAIRAYERVGFKPVGVMRQYERGPDGTFHDGLLMDMLRGELRERDPSRNK
jgi:aminoglycoside 6'-N-acetyltransferase